MVRVLLCDDLDSFGILFKAWIEDCDDLELVGHAATGADAVDAVGRDSPDVIVVDHLLREMTSVDLAPQLRAAGPDARILLISGMPEPVLAELADASGADGYLSKSASPGEVCDAIRRVAL